ncbi:MAG: ribonuclease HI [bacterium]
MEKIKIFTDGSSRGNPGPGGWGAVLIYPEASGKMEVEELGGGDKNTTNNKMELMAAIEAFKNFNNHGKNFEDKIFSVYTDSSYLINGITKWVHGWQKNNWITGAKQSVLNQDLWKELMSVTSGKKISWNYVAGHAGIPANERCDEIATAFADEVTIDLYKGALSEYSVDTNNFSGHLIGEKKTSNKSAKARSKAVAYSYLSMLDGVIKTHKTWVECEKRVKGQSGAKYKKALSEIEEKEIIKSWESNK